MHPESDIFGRRAAPDRGQIAPRGDTRRARLCATKVLRSPGVVTCDFGLCWTLWAIETGSGTEIAYEPETAPRDPRKAISLGLEGRLGRSRA